MISNYISINTILQEVVRDLGMGDEPVPLSDFKEWIIEGLKHIGVITQYRKVRKDVEITDYVGELPCDFFKLSKIIDGVMFKHNPDLTFNKDSTVDEKQSQLLAVKRTETDINIEQKNVIASFRNGIVKMLYWAFPLDKEGFIMLPDDISYKDALMWKVAYQLSMRGYKFKNPQMRDIRFTGTHWRFYVKQARAAGLMPDLELMERLKNDFLTLVINPNQYTDNFRFLGNRENLQLDSSSGRVY